MKPCTQCIFIALLMCALLIACGPSHEEQDTRATQEMASKFATQAALAPTSTYTPEPTDTPTVTHTATSSPTATLSPSQIAKITQFVVQTEKAVTAKQTMQAKRTATALAAQETQQAEDAMWARLVEDHSVTLTKGELHTVDNLEESWAQDNWYRWWQFGFKLSNFVIASHIEWRAPAGSDTYLSGCGFAVRIKDENNHLIVFITPQTRAIIGAMTPGGYSRQAVHWEAPDLPINYIDKEALEHGIHDLWVAAEDDFITIYLDGVKYYEYYVGNTYVGDMGYTIISGTYKEPGTYCKFTDTRVWELVK